MRTAKKHTPGQKLLSGLLRADAYDQDVSTLTGANRVSQVTRRWMAGMSRSLREKFADGLRSRREELGLTQKNLADVAGLTATAVAMIERGERAPSFDSATRLCWALDVTAGLQLEDL